MADETKAYKVSLADGSEASIVRVPLRHPVVKTLRRHQEYVRELADGRKKLEFELREVEHSIDMEAEMRADAIRAWNGNVRSIAARNLIVEAVSEPTPQPQQVSAPRRVTRAEPEAVKV